MASAPLHSSLRQTTGRVRLCSALACTPCSAFLPQRAWRSSIVASGPTAPDQLPNLYASSSARPTPPNPTADHGISENQAIRKYRDLLLSFRQLTHIPKHDSYDTSSHFPDYRCSLENVLSIWSVYAQLRIGPFYVAQIDQRSIECFLRRLLHLLLRRRVAFHWRSIPKALQKPETLTELGVDDNGFITPLVMANRVYDDMQKYRSPPSSAVRELLAIIAVFSQARAQVDQAWNEALAAWDRDQHPHSTVRRISSPLTSCIQRHIKGNTSRHLQHIALAMVHVYTRTGQLDKCQSVIKEYQSRLGGNLTRPMYGVLLQGYSRLHQMDMATKVWNELYSESTPPGINQYNSYLLGLAAVRDSAGFDQVLASLEQHYKYLGDAQTCGIIILYMLSTSQFDRLRTYASRFHASPGLVISSSTRNVLHRLATEDLESLNTDMAHLTTTRAKDIPFVLDISLLALHYYLATNHPQEAMAMYEELLVPPFRPLPTPSPDASQPPFLWMNSRVEYGFQLMFQWLLEDKRTNALKHLVAVTVQSGVRFSIATELIVTNTLTTLLSLETPSTESLIRQLFRSTDGMTAMVYIHSVLDALPHDPTQWPGTASDGPTPAAPNHTTLPAFASKSDKLPSNDSHTTLFDSLVQRLMVEYGCHPGQTFLAVLNALMGHRLLEWAELFFDYMTRNDYFPTPLVCHTMVSGYVRLKRVDQAVQFCQRAIQQYQFPLHPATLRSLISGHINAKQLDPACDLFAHLVPSFVTLDGSPLELPVDLKTYTIAMRLFQHMGDIAMVDALFTQMLEVGILPDNRAYRVWFDAHAHSGDLEKVQQRYADMIQSGLVPDTDIAFHIAKTCALINDSMTLSSYFSEFVFGYQFRLNASTYNHILQCLCRTRSGLSVALQLFKRMLQDSVPPGTKFTSVAIAETHDAFTRPDPFASNRWLAPWCVSSPNSAQDDQVLALADTPLSTSNSADHEMMRQAVLQSPVSGQLLFELPDDSHSPVRPPRPNALSFKILIRTAGHWSEWAIVAGLFELYQSHVSPPLPNLRIYSWAITAYAQLGEATLAEEVWTEFRTSSLYPYARQTYGWVTLEELVKLNLDHIHGK
ncbi:hypothetical protein H4R34_005023 [Dimargaris verticillata]|uniref:Pentacotripeptide-repeat region of PRORP domain-containing protein n=1 Tax=Dimargaris verticillata TaxID=2761393 RepID=A0A9W8EB51_9FUNG|nr:hypothetical protein H4R34_005023 [Dimargaris verticillata]